MEFLSRKLRHAFRDLVDVQQRFVEFWELLSRQRVIEGNLERELLQPERAVSTHRALTLLKEPEFKLGRNSLYQYIEPAVTKALTDEGMITDPVALRACYVETSERIKFDSRLKMYLADIKPPLGRAAVRIKTRKSKDFLTHKIAASAKAPPHFFLLLGPVGAGKTTFLNYTRSVSAVETIEGKMLWLAVDFKKATKSDDPKKFIYAELLRFIDQDKDFGLGEWKTSILPAYQEEISALERGPLFLLRRNDQLAFDKHVSEAIMQDRSQVEPYVEAIVRNALKSRAGFLIVDNVDQIDKEETQNAIFAEAQAAAQRMGLNVIMSLRDSTYIRSRHSPTFDAFQVDSIYVDPPSVLPVLSRRLQYARKLLTGHRADLTLSNAMRLKVDDLGAFFDVVGQSMLAKDAGFMLDVLAGGDIRRGLLLCREFLASGHTTADRALQNYVSDRAFRFSPHEIFKGATLGHRKFYREEESLLINLYSAKLGSSALELLKFRTVHFLVSQAQVASFEGYQAERIIEELHQSGIVESEVEATLKNLLIKRVIRTADGADYSRASRLLPTRLAGYLLNDLARRFNYVEMCTLDATIYDEIAWQRIVQLTAAIQRERDSLSGIPNRLDRVREFVTYLIGLEEKWVVEARRRNLQQPWREAVISSVVLPALEQDFATVLQSVERQRLRRQGYQSDPER